MISLIRKGILIIMACVGGVIGGCESKKVPLNKEQFREKLRRERAVELAYEDHRFWDIRRWLIADDEGVMKGAMYGLQLSAVTGAPGKVHYKPYVFENRLWSDRSYLHPIKQTEIDKGYMLQNPGW